MTLSRQLVRGLSSTGFDAIPAVIRAKALVHIQDAIGVGLAAAASRAGSAHVRYASTLSETAGRGATLLCDGRMVDTAQASLVNGGLIHSLEYDDTHTASIVHGSSVILPTALAVAEEHGLGGAELMRLYVVGYEALIRIGLAAPGLYQRAGFQVTSVGGALVAAAMAANAAGLDENVGVAAVGIALSQASGSMEFLSNGSSVKSLHPGWAAHCGIVAARLAQAGMTGPETAIEGRFGAMSLFTGGSAMAGSPDFDSIGRTWHLADVAIKFHPACHYLHAFVECARLLRRTGVGIGEIEKLICRVPAGAAGVICEPWSAKQNPPTGHASRWSLPVTVAMALRGDDVLLDAFERLPTQDELEIAGRTDWVPLEDTRFPARYDAEIVCILQSGQILDVRVDDAYGNRSRPPSQRDIGAKFLGNAERKLGKGRSAVLASTLAALPTSNRIGLTGLLGP